MEEIDPFGGSGLVSLVTIAQRGSSIYIIVMSFFWTWPISAYLNGQAGQSPEIIGGPFISRDLLSSSRGHLGTHAGETPICLNNQNTLT
jgi:hypothetical protein